MPRASRGVGGSDSVRVRESGLRQRSHAYGDYGLQEARHHAQVGAWDRARTLLDEVLAVAPENVTARNVLALGAMRRGDVDAAEAQYLASLARQPRQHRVVGALGAIELRRGRLDAAERSFREALDLAPTYVEAMSNLGWVAAARGDEAGARAWYERAIAADPTYPHVYRRLADLFYDRRERKPPHRDVAQVAAGEIGVVVRTSGSFDSPLEPGLRGRAVLDRGVDASGDAARVDHARVSVVAVGVA